MLLEVTGLTAGYGRGTIIEGVDMTVDRGEVVAIIGPNGAGKSTALRAIAGQLAPSAGTVVFDGRDVSRWDCARKSAAGLVFIPQGLNVFPQMTLTENLELAGYQLGDKALLARRIETVFDLYPWMRERRTEKVSGLSGGQRQALALARIVLTMPKLVLLDEPSLGLAPSVVDEIFSRIAEVNRGGVAVLLVEQNARKGLSAADRGYVLEQGRNRLTGTGAALLDDSQVQKLYLGG